jgi:ubiquinone/menaquinone biosynthesis C-methylase UbiE
MKSQTEEQLALEYELRFARLEEYRARVWNVLCESFFQRFIKKDNAILDLGCGWGEFINAIKAGKKYGMDLNPESPNHLKPEVEFIHQDCSLRWPLEDEALDVVFTSNFFEHLPSKDSLLATIKEANRCLKKTGMLICMGPNIKYVGGAYWDFADHYLPLTDVSMEEFLRLGGFREMEIKKRFLPYTMAKGFQPPIPFLRLYLKMPLVWRFFGGQFLVFARKG